MASMDKLNDSARIFTEKKALCQDFAEKAMKLATTFEKDFPPAEIKSKKQPGKKATARKKGQKSAASDNEKDSASQAFDFSGKVKKFASAFGNIFKTGKNEDTANSEKELSAFDKFTETASFFFERISQEFGIEEKARQVSSYIEKNFLAAGKQNVDLDNDEEYGRKMFMDAIGKLTEGARTFTGKLAKYIDFSETGEKSGQQTEIGQNPVDALPENKANADAAKSPEATQVEDISSGGQGAVLREIYEKIKNDRLKILVAGQFKQGKSTLVNALLGQEILPAQATPCTAVITEITYGKSKSATLKFKSRINELPKGLATKAVEHIGKRYNNIPDLVIKAKDLGSELQKYLVIPESDSAEPEEMAKEAVAESPYACCRIAWPLQICRNGVEIIDSPGLDEATARDETTYNYVPQADMILHVLNATQFFGTSDRKFVEKIQLLGVPSLIFLLNRFDQVNDREKNRVRDWAMKQLPAYTSYGERGIFFVSAWNALNARKNRDEELFDKSGFAAFEARIAEIIEKDRVKIKLADNLNRICARLEYISASYIPELSKKINSDGNRLKKKYEAAQSEFAALDERKTVIQQTISEGLLEIYKLVHNELLIFFKDFAKTKLPPHLKGVNLHLDFTDLLFDRQATINRALEILKNEMFAALEQELEKLMASLSRQTNNIMDNMNRTIKVQLKDFKNSLKAIRAEMNMTPVEKATGIGNLNINNSSLLSSLDGAMDESLMDGVFKGVMAGGAVWGMSQFIALLAGPIGWGFILTSAIGAAIFSMNQDGGKEAVIVNSFIKEADKAFQEKSQELANNLAQTIMNELYARANTLMDRLERYIMDTKGPIEEAIKLLDSNKAELANKKKLLASYQKKFASLLDQGNELQACI